ncbi:FliH/SctL family protein [Bradyrhizobium sp. CB3481]|uniref:FliH/SctL family protein n=1 Tax=Bradyrhizobium sp. CB3481 TaxID=3039158 RepID=UPI0024B2545D|nr:FliH/SctL family protein [Bradyrhizobium sp. CB3481]WFU14889.1 FliH/SctL family protein [Bradyrhizobium sp. CB3481]
MVALVQLTSGSVNILGPGRILPAASAQALLDAEQVLNQARREAEALVEAARESASKIETAANEAGLQAAQAKMQERLIALAIEPLRIVEQSKDRIVDMGLQIARRILDTIAPDDGTVQLALRGFEFVGHAPFVRLRVAPSLVETVRRRLDEIVSVATSSAVVEVISDPCIKDAGCILETDAGLVDATIESQLRSIESALRNSLEGFVTG